MKSFNEYREDNDPMRQEINGDLGYIAKYASQLITLLDGKDLSQEVVGLIKEAHARIQRAYIVVSVQ